MDKRVIATFLCLLAIANESSATLTPIAPFSGSLTETWESFPLTGPSETYLQNPSGIMGGMASISNPFMATFILGSGYQLGSSGYPSPSDGTQYMGIGGFGRTAMITFDDPIVSFGAYWGGWSAGASSPAVLSVTFLDEANLPIATEQFDYLRPFDGVLEWHGWLSDTPIKYITYSGDYPTVDGLQANPIPEPASLSFLVLSLLVMHRRRLPLTSTPCKKAHLDQPRLIA